MRAPALRRLARRGLRPAHRALRRIVLWKLWPLFRLRRRSGPPDGRPRVRILLQHVNGTGGTIRTVLNLSGYLAREHDIEIVSVTRFREEPFFRVPDGVKVTVADDRLAPRRRTARLLSRLPSLLTPADDATFRSMNLWTDLCLLKALRGVPPDVLIGTRPSLNLLAAELGPPGVPTIGQDHMNLGSYRPGLRRQIRRTYRRLTVLTALTETARAEYAAALPRVRVVRIPNAMPAPCGRPSPRDGKVVIAAGRLVRQKGFDLLIRAYEPLAAEHPGWTLRIFGSGARHAQLAAMIDERRLADRIELRPRSGALAAEMDRSSIYVLSSRYEGMPMVLIEAMGKGLPVVAFDCPAGPGEMITDGRDGLLVPPGDVPALTAALRRLIGEPELRDRLGGNARDAARAYDLENVGPQWSRLLASLRRPRGRP